MQFAPKFLFFVPQYRDDFFADFDLYIGGETGKLRNLGFRQCKTIIMPLIPTSYSSVSFVGLAFAVLSDGPSAPRFLVDVFSFVVHAEFEVGILQRIFISQTTNFHFANYRFSFRKLQIFIFVSFHFVSQTTVSLCFKPPVSRCLLFSKMNSRQENRSNLSFYSQNYNWYSSEIFFFLFIEKTKGFLKFCKLKLISNLILGQISVSVKS